MSAKVLSHNFVKGNEVPSKELANGKPASSVAPLSGADINTCKQVFQYKLTQERTYGSAETAKLFVNMLNNRWVDERRGDISDYNEIHGGENYGEVKADNAKIIKMETQKAKEIPLEFLKSKNVHTAS